MSDLWHNAPLLNRISDLLLAAAALLVFYGAIRFAIVQPVFAIRELRVVGASEHLQAQQVAALARRDIRGTFFTFDIVRLRNGFEKLPWVRKADVRRQWPNGVEVNIEAHQVLARWGKSALVNVQGEVFEAAYTGSLPQFNGPDGTAAEITVQYEVFRHELAAIGRVPVQVSLSPRRAWQLRLDNGMTLEVGREQVPARLARFLAAYPHTIEPLGRNADYVDLRYANGFAVRVPELSKNKAGAADQKPPAAARRRA